MNTNRHCEPHLPHHLHMPSIFSSDPAFDRQRKDMESRRELVRSNADDQGVISCLKCSLSNPRGHRFCRQCGSTLWKNCPQCSSERPIDEAFCAACGADIKSVEQQLIESQKERFANVQKMIDRLDFNEAVRHTRLLAGENHPGLEEIRVQAERLLPAVTAERDRFAERATEQLGEPQSCWTNCVSMKPSSNSTKSPSRCKTDRHGRYGIKPQEHLKRLKHCGCACCSQRG